MNIGKKLRRMLEREGYEIVSISRYGDGDSAIRYKKLPNHSHLPKDLTGCREKEVKADNCQKQSDNGFSGGVNSTKNELKKGVYIERAEPLTEEGIKAVCMSDKDYEEYCKKKKNALDTKASPKGCFKIMQKDGWWCRCVEPILCNKCKEDTFSVNGCGKWNNDRTIAHFKCGDGNICNECKEDTKSEIKELTKEELLDLPKEVVEGFGKSLADIRAGRYKVVKDIKSETHCNLCGNKSTEDDLVVLVNDNENWKHICKKCSKIVSEDVQRHYPEDIKSEVDFEAVLHNASTLATTSRKSACNYLMDVIQGLKVKQYGDENKSDNTLTKRKMGGLSDGTDTYGMLGSSCQADDRLGRDQIKAKCNCGGLPGNNWSHETWCTSQDDEKTEDKG